MSGRGQTCKVVLKDFVSNGSHQCVGNNLQPQIGGGCVCATTQGMNRKNSMVPCLELNATEMASFDRVPPMDPYHTLAESLDIANKMIEKYMEQDNAFPALIDKMRVSAISGPTLSGLQEHDYPTSIAYPSLASVNHLKLLNKVPLPPEILEQCGNMQGDFIMGLFPEINRAWLTVDSDIYIWNFETGGDVAYYDGLSEVIVSVGLVKPKPDVFQNFIKHLLILTTASEIIILGVILQRTIDKKYGEELQLTPEIIYALSTDGVPIASIAGTDSGRIFLGGRDGSLFEIVYQKQIGWWGKRCKKINHSKSTLLFLLPAFVNAAFYEEDPIIQIVIDNSRNILYTLSEKSSIEVFDLGHSGQSMSRVASMTHSTLINNTSAIVSTIDPREISSVVTLCPLEVVDSQEVGLVAVTYTGVRLFFTTGATPPNRPSTLHVIHVRLPPGYSANSESFRPHQVITAKQRGGNFLIVSGYKEAHHDKLWCFTNDNFPMKHWFTESCSSYNLPGQTIGLALLSEDNPVEGMPGPLLVYQHNYSPDKIAVLTQQGTEIYEKLRPVDVLAELLRERNGPDCDVIKHYFTLQGNDQACASALVLACNMRTSNLQMAEWATRAFFLYGGHPKQIAQPQQHNIHPYTLPAGFKPNTVSTPIGNKTVTSPSDSSSYQMSSKHNGLYLYLCRILRPIWMKYIAEKVRMADGMEYLTSNVKASQLVSISGQLLELKQFLDKHTQMSNSVPTQNCLYQDPSIHEVTVTSPTSQRSRVTILDAVTQEKKSLDSLKALVDHSTQVLGFWRVMCEHQFHVLAESLTQEQQQQMMSATFRDLVLAGRDLCSNLINKLINSYLSDNTSVDAISLKLREVCPTLYRSEDAACSKANEILKAAKDQLDQDEKLSMLRSSIKLCKEVSPHVNLSWVCKQLVACKYYEGVLELCNDTANKLDPNNFALHFNAKDQPMEDTVGYKAYANRFSAYKEVTVMLDQLYQHCQFGGTNPPLLFPNDRANSQAQAVLQEVLLKCFEVDDEVLHVAVYDWLIVRNLHASLVTFGRPSLERYLGRRTVDNQVRDLLWQYHERNGNHAAAAQILYNLANTSGENVNLQQRLTYLGKAVMCMRSDGAGCAPHLGIFLHELEDMVQVARVQKQILDKISNLGIRDSRSEDAIKKLNSSLITITELYEEFAEPFGLWESKLTILDCAGHDDRDLINLIWNNIISEEMKQCSTSSSDDQMLIIMSKVKSLGLQFTVQSPCFPLDYLVWQLEILSCRLDVNKSHVHSTLISIGVSVGALLEIYDKLFSVNDRCWLNEGNEFHIIQVIACFADSFIANPRMASSSERRSLAVRMKDLITNCLSTLYSKPDTRQLQTYLKTIQTNLDRIS